MKRIIFLLVLTGILFHFVSGGTMLRNALMSNNDIEKVSATYWDRNQHLENQLLAERRSAWLSLLFLIGGTISLIVAHFLQQKSITNSNQATQSSINN